MSTVSVYTYNNFNTGPVFAPYQYVYALTSVTGSGGLSSSAITGYPSTVTSQSSGYPTSGGMAELVPTNFYSTVDITGLSSGTYNINIVYSLAGHGTFPFMGQFTVSPTLTLMASPLLCCQNNPILTWTLPTGSTDTGFVLKRGATTIYNGPLFAFQDSGLTYGDTYSYTVTGMPSGEVSAAVLVTPTACAVLPSPGQPSWSGICTGASIPLTWPVVAGASGYVVQRDGVQVYSDATNTFTDTGVTVGVAYAYTVASVNCGGTGPFGPGLTVVPCTYPTPPAPGGCTIWTGGNLCSGTTWTRT